MPQFIGLANTFEDVFCTNGSICEWAKTTTPVLTPFITLFILRVNQHSGC